MLGLPGQFEVVSGGGALALGHRGRAAERDGQIIEDVRRISSALEKKSKRELAKRAKQTALEQFEITLESVEAESFDQGGQGGIWPVQRIERDRVRVVSLEVLGVEDDL